MPLAEFLVALVAAGILVRVLASALFWWSAVDVPNDRSLHVKPVSRTGGLGLLAGAGLGAAMSSHAGVALMACLAAALGGAFFIDDVRGLSAAVRLVLQVVTATVFVIGSSLWGGYWLFALLLVLCLVWSMNLYNFMDGANGLAGGMTVLGFGAYAIAAHMSSVGDLAAVAAAICGGALGFLVWNFDPARIFLGDAGSVALGFLAAAIGVLGWQRGAWPFWFPALVFSPFIVDATVTLLRRALRGERVWRAHKAHYYQRLVRMGWSHRRLALTAYVLMAAVAGSALLARGATMPAVSALLLAWSVVYTSIAVAIDRRWSAFEALVADNKPPGDR